MKIKKFLTTFLTAAIAATSVFSMSVFAEGTEDFTASSSDISKSVDAKVDNGNREQSFSIEFTAFDPTRMTKDSEIVVTYDVVKDAGKSGDKVELVAQKYPDEQRKDYKGKSGKVDGDALWKIVKADSDDGKGTATFKYDSIVKSFGTDDFTVLDKLNVEAASESTIKCTGFKVTKVLPEKKGTHPKADSGFAWYWIVIAAVVGVAICVAIVMLILNKKSDKAFDVTTGRYIDKKKVGKD